MEFEEWIDSLTEQDKLVHLREWWDSPAFHRGNWPFAEIRNILQTLTLLCEENGAPCDGFRFRELVLQARKVLAASK